MFRFEVTVDAAVNVVSYISRELSDLREFYEERFYPKMLRDFDKLFEVQGRPPWAALFERYGKWKAMHFPYLGILQLSGVLRDSYTISSHPDHELDITDRTIAIRSLVEYAALHESGTDRMTDRPVVGSLTLDTGLRNQYNKLLRRHVQKIIRDSKQEGKVGVGTSVGRRQTGTASGRQRIRQQRRLGSIRINR